jgi:hypothetical protein
VRASSRELLEALVRPPLRGALLVLVDDAAGDEEALAAQAAHYFASRPLDCVPLLGELLGAPSGGVQALAAYHAAELGLQRFRERLEAVRGGATRELREVLDSALQMLELRAPPPDEGGEPQPGASDAR